MRQFYQTLNSLSIGDRIVVPKSNLDLIQHHAIFLGFDNGHYWIIENKEGYGVRLVTAEVFFLGVNKITRVKKFTPSAGYSRNELVKYALSKKGKAYHLTNYNCEHFANEVQHRVVKSHQTETAAVLGLLAGVALLIGLSK